MSYPGQMAVALGSPEIVAKIGSTGDIHDQAPVRGIEHPTSHCWACFQTTLPWPESHKAVAGLVSAVTLHGRKFRFSGQCIGRCPNSLICRKKRNRAPLRTCTSDSPKGALVYLKIAPQIAASGHAGGPTKLTGLNPLPASSSVPVDPTFFAFAPKVASCVSV